MKDRKEDAGSKIKYLYTHNFVWVLVNQKQQTRESIRKTKAQRVSAHGLLPASLTLKVRRSVRTCVSVYYMARGE